MNDEYENTTDISHPIMEDHIMGVRSAGGWRLVAVHRLSNDATQYYWTRPKAGANYMLTMVRDQAVKAFLDSKGPKSHAENE